MTIARQLKSFIRECGASAVAFAQAKPIDPAVAAEYSRWIADGHSAGMDYLLNHEALRTDPSHLLPDAKTVICIAFNYHPADFRKDLSPVACYAWGKDYHKVLRKRLKPVCIFLKEELGAESRVCIDSAPVAERYWAIRSGLGKPGLNGAIIVPGVGSMCFLAEIITTLEVLDETRTDDNWGECNKCGNCLRACPTKALSLNENGHATLDARRCLSYLTIEHRGDWTAEQKAVISEMDGQVPAFGCDACLRACPLNHQAAPSSLPEFQPNPNLSKLIEKLQSGTLTPEEFDSLSVASPIRRATFSGLLRNQKAKRSINQKTDPLTF